MGKLRIQRFSAPDETIRFVDKGRIEVLHVGDGSIARAIFEPGWRWSKHERSMAGTESCQVPHSGYVLSGRLRVVMDDGQEAEIAPGDWVTVPPGHDAWTVGREPCVLLDVAGLQAPAQSGRGTGDRPAEGAGVH
jgi:mannose-6-phosphate isomerase-like protein (cupin superfamily)